MSRAGVQKRYLGRDDEIRPRPDRMLDRELLTRWLTLPHPRPDLLKWVAEEVGFF